MNNTIFTTCTGDMMKVARIYPAEIFDIGIEGGFAAAMSKLQRFVDHLRDCIQGKAEAHYTLESIIEAIKSFQDALDVSNEDIVTSEILQVIYNNQKSFNGLVFNFVELEKTDPKETWILAYTYEEAWDMAIRWKVPLKIIDVEEAIALAPRFK